MPPADATARGRCFVCAILDAPEVGPASEALPSSHFSISGMGMIRRLPRRTIRSSGWTWRLKDDSLIPTALTASSTVRPRRGGEGRFGMAYLLSIEAVVCIGYVRKRQRTPPAIRRDGGRGGLQPHRQQPPSNDSQPEKTHEKGSSYQPRMRFLRAAISAMREPSGPKAQQPTATTLTPYHFVKRAGQNALPVDREGDAVHR